MVSSIARCSPDLSEAQLYGPANPLPKGSNSTPSLSLCIKPMVQGSQNPQETSIPRQHLGVTPSKIKRTKSLTIKYNSSRTDFWKDPKEVKMKYAWHK